MNAKPARRIRRAPVTLPAATDLREVVPSGTGQMMGDAS
jgi:hypothetical protein